MTLVVDISLPQQPSEGGADTGFTRYIPLGGDGFTSPRQMCRVDVNIAGDASGGNLFIILRMDKAYVSVVSYMRIKQTDSSVIAMEANIIPEAVGTFALRTSTTGSSEFTWVPPPVILEQADNQITAPRISCQKVNIEDDEFILNAEIYLFDKRAREVGRAEDLLALIGRGGQRFT